MTETNQLLNRYHGAAVIVLLFIAAFLRFYKLDQYPLFINADELSNIYDGYSFAETGNDRAAESYYIVVRGFGSGDYRPSLMPWLLAAMFKVFGYSVLNGRILAAVLGMVSLLLLYLFTKEVAGKDFAFITLVLTTFSPWHLTFSRMVHEGTMLPSVFLLLTMLVWKRSREKKFSIRSLILLGFVIGFSVNAYQGTRLTGLLLVILVGIDVIVVSGFSKSFSRIGILSLSAGIGALPQLVFLFERPDLFFMRSQYAMPPYHSLLDFLLTTIKNLFVDLNPAYLFFSFGTPNIFTVARLLPVELPFFFIGLFLLKRVINTKTFKPLFIYLVTVIAILPAAVTLDNPHDLRASQLMILAPIISAAGVMNVIALFKSASVQCVVYLLMLVLIIVNSSIFIYLYTRSYDLRNNYQQHDLVVLAEKVNEEGKDCSRVFIQDIENQPYIYLTAFTGISPREFQSMEKSVNTNWIWDLYTQLGRFYFENKEQIESEFQKQENEKRLFIYSERRNDPLPIDSVLSSEAGWMYFYKK